MRRSLVVVLTAALATTAAAASAQSFDCTKAHTPVEHAICAQPSLGALDQALATALTEARTRPGTDAPTLRTSQSAWLRERDATCKVPPARLTACLTAILSARLAALAPPVQAAPPNTPTPIPASTPPTIPSAANPPQPDAALDRTTLTTPEPTAEPASTLLQVRTPGRFSLAASSPSGTAIQLIDMMAGPAPIAGEPGIKDGRTDLLLDTGTYKLRVLPAPNATGPIQLTATPFRDAAPPTATPDPSTLASAPLTDLQQRSFWLAIGPDGLVQIDAAGRALADLRLWQNGTALAPIEPTSRLIEPVPGHPLLGLRLLGTVEPGTYLVTAYGGPPLAWADGATEMPFHLRASAPPRLAEGWANATIGPMGSEWFAVPPRANAFYLTLPAPAPATLAVDNQIATIAANSREPTATLQAPAAKLVEVTGAAGQLFRLRAQETSTALSFAKPGRWWLSASILGAGGEEAPPTALLLQSEGTAPARLLASTAPLIRPGTPWRTQFNVRGPTTLLLQTQGAGELAVRSASQSLGTVHWQPRRAQMPAGLNEYFLEPPTGKQGVADLLFSLGTPETTPPTTPPWPPNPTIPLGLQTLTPTQHLDLATNTAPNLQPGLLARAAPVALAEGPLILAQMPGIPLEIPIRVTPGGTLAISDPATGDLPIPFQPNPDGIGTVALPAPDHPRTIILAWRRSPIPRPAIPAPPARDPAATLNPTTPQFLDLHQDEQRSFDLTVPTGGLYRIETTGRLHTTATIGTAFTPALDQAEANGIGENALLQRWLRAGTYRIRVGAQASAGHLGLRVTPTPLQDGAKLLPGGTIRAALPAATGLATPITITEPGKYRLELLGQARTFNARLDDAEGWPLTAPGPLNTLERDFTPGQYRLLIAPEAVPVRILARLTRLQPPTTLTGHGPHPLRPATPAANTWREPAGRDDPRTPDTWTFTLQGPAETTLRITPGMIANLKREGMDRPILRLIGPTPLKTTLEPGRYTLEATSQGRNDRLDYTLTLNTTELQPGIPRRVDPDATVPFTLAEPGVATLTTFGPVPLTAVLRDQTGQELGRYNDRGNDWNIAISRLLPAGSYRIELHQAVPPDLADVTPKETPPAQTDSTDNTDSDEDKPEPDPGEPAAQSHPTKTEPDPTATASDDPPPKAKTELTLALPAPLDPLPAPAGITELTGPGIHRFTLPQPPSNRLLLATAHSSAAVALTLERQDGPNWQTIAEAQGTDPIAAAPTDDQPTPWRLSIWTVDSTPAPIRIAVQAVVSTPQPPGTLTPRPLEAATNVAIAHLQLEGPTPIRLSGPTLLAGGWPGHPLTPPDADLATAQSDTLWLVTRTPSPITAIPITATPNQPLTLSVTATSQARLTAPRPAPGTIRAWRADSALGQPGLEAGQGMGIAPGSALATGPTPVRIWNAGNDTTLRPRITALDLATQTPIRADAPLSVLLPPNAALHLTLPEGNRRTDLALAPGMAAIAGTGNDAITIWNPETATTRSLPGAWTDLLLLNTTPIPAPASIAWTTGPTPTLTPGTVLKRFYGAAGSQDIQVEAPPNARLILTGNAQATFLARTGQVQRGSTLTLPGLGRLTLTYAPGPLALWLETPNTTPWPQITPTPQQIPAQIPLTGEAMALSLAITSPTLLHARTSAPVILTLGQDSPTLYPAGAVLNHPLATPTTLRIDSPQDGPLTGSLELEADPITPIEDGLGPPITLAPGATAVFAFQVPRTTEIGVGITANPANARTRLLTADGTPIAEGAALLRRLETGRYLLEVHLPPEAPTTVIRPAIVGIAPRGSGPPPDIARSYLALVGLAPKDAP